MKTVKLQTRAQSQITVTDTAATLFDLMQTAAEGDKAALNFFTGKDANAIWLRPADGEIRIMFDDTPTASIGMPIGAEQGIVLSRVDLDKMELIRTGSASVTVDLLLFTAQPGESSSLSGGGGGGGTPTNPTEVGGIYNEDELTLTDGESEALQLDINAFLKVVSKSFDTATAADKNSRVDPEWSHSTLYGVFTLTNVPNATPDRTIIIDMEGYEGCSFHFEETGGGDTHAITIEASNEGTAAGDDKIDITTSGMTLAGGSLTGDAMLHTNKGMRAKAVGFVLTTAGAADDLDGQVFVYRW